MPMHSPPPGEAAAEDSENYFLLDTSRLEEGFEELVDEIVPKAPSSSRRLLVFADVLGIGAFVLLWADPAEPIDLFRWVAATLSFALVFALLACVQLTRLGFHIHLHAGGFLYCAIIHAGLHLHRQPPEAQTVDDSLANWPLMLFVTPLMWAFGASAALRDQPGLPSLDLRSLLFGGGAAAAPTAALPAAAAAFLPEVAPRAGELQSARAHNFVCYFVPFWLGTLPNFAAKAKLLPDFSLSVRSMARWGPAQYAEVAVGAAMVAHLFGYHLLRAYREARLLPLAAFYALAFGGLALTIAHLGPTHDAHMHHYFTAALLVPLTRCSGGVSACWQGLLVGFQLQGVAVFGMPPLFYRKH